ncbi:alpha/beta fold hydrolase [Arenibacterium sp. CAU 1754]
MNTIWRWERTIRDSLKIFDPDADTRDRVIAAIYETVIRPELYDAFMDAWDDHIQAVLTAQNIDTIDGTGDGDNLRIDPELKAHFTRAYQILEQIGRKTPQSSIMDQISAASGFALLIDAAGQVVAASTAASNVLKGALHLDGLREQLTANSADLLDTLLGEVQLGKDTAAPVVLSTGIVPRHLMARVTPVTTPAGATRPMVMVEALEYRWSDQAERMLVNSFALSRAEVDIVRNLLAGHSLREIAAQSGRSEHTVRNQAKAVLAKTGAPGQVDLIRLVVFLINQEGSTRPVNEENAALRDEIMRMSTGLDMQVIHMGPENGYPVLFLHGMLDGTAPLHFFQSEFKRRKLRVIAPVRPGFGRSQPVARADQALDFFTDHLIELIEKTGVKRPVIFGHLGGALFGHILTCRLGKRVAGMVGDCGVSPIVRLSQLARMAPRQRVVAYTARFAPALLPTVLRAGIAQIDSKEVHDFTEALFKSGSQEHQVMTRLDLAELFATGLSFSIEQGHIGFATDSHYVVRDWSREIDRLDTRVIYVAGAHDPVNNVADAVAAMKNRPNVEVRVIEDAGQLLFFERPDLVFDAIREVIDTAARA